MIEQEWLACNDPVAMLKLLDGRHWVIDNRRNRAGVDSFLLRTPSDRQLRLFACACRRQVPGLRWDGQSSGWQRMEEHPEAEVLANEVGPHTIPAIEHARLLLGSQENPSQAEMANLLREIIGNPFRPVTIAPSWLTWNDGAIPRLAEEAYEERVVMTCVRCTQGENPIYTAGVGKLRWHAGDGATGVVNCPDCHGTGTIATGELDPARLAIIGDALEEAGCNEDEVLCPRCNGKDYFAAGDRMPDMFPSVCPTCDRCPYQKDGGTVRVPNPLLAHLRSPGPHVRGCWAIDALRGVK